MDTLMLFLQLFWTFFVIGAFTIGGGYAMLSLIQGEVVTSHQWISESTFTDIVAISQMTPGPIGINTATYVGYDVLNQATGSHLLGIAGSAPRRSSWSSRPPGSRERPLSGSWRKTSRTGRAGACWRRPSEPLTGEK